ncbi:hypothetical protein BV25DRAFT_1548031 [Artomyces pyxidatus]|uniref:Uncharacterized protein n=1 Tax=Artomyces pyxidatus TaxID=48021 RepID=A0ACB8SJZ0_9AGAM|nr:hypothetical protein BV25DRAFT_1548031 [Artomyces pyxidatus]
MVFHLTVEEAARSSRKNIKKVGRGYHKQSLEAIRFCRSLAQNSPHRDSTQNDALVLLYDLVDCAIDAAASAGKFEPEEATVAFQTLEVEVLKYVDKYHKGQTVILGNFRDNMEEARREDASSMKLCNRIVQRVGSNSASAFNTDNTVTVTFVVLQEPHARDETMRTFPMKIDPRTATVNAEVLWNLRCMRACSIKQNPQFYIDQKLPEEPSSYGPEFILCPDKELGVSIRRGASTFCVLTDGNSCVFVKYEAGECSRTFGNIYRPESTVILKDQSGLLEAAGTVIKSASPSPSPRSATQSSSRRAQARETGIGAWRESLGQALTSDTQDWVLHPTEPPVSYRHTGVLSLPPPPTKSPGSPPPSHPTPKPVTPPALTAVRPPSPPIPSPPPPIPSPPPPPPPPPAPTEHNASRRPSLAPLQGLPSSSPAPYQSGSNFGSYTAVHPSTTSSGIFSSSGSFDAYSTASSAYRQPNSSPP